MPAVAKTTAPKQFIVTCLRPRATAEGQPRPRADLSEARLPKRAQLMTMNGPVTYEDAREVASRCRCDVKQAAILLCMGDNDVDRAVCFGGGK
jgi:hypothetical protein